MSINSDRNDISTEPGPGPDENDNLGAQDGKGEPATVPPNEGGGESEDVVAEDPAED